VGAKKPFFKHEEKTKDRNTESPTGERGGLRSGQNIYKKTKREETRQII
jgi:hypothetical protein